MRIGVEGGQILLYGRKDRDTEIIKVKVDYIIPTSKKGAKFTLVPTRLRDLRYGDCLAIKVSRKHLIVKRGLFMFVGQDVYRIKSVNLFDDDLKKPREDKILDSILDVNTTKKYKTIQRFLFKGVNLSGNISEQSRVHTDRKQRRSKKARAKPDIQSKRVWRKRRHNKTI